MHNHHQIQVSEKRRRRLTLAPLGSAEQHCFGHRCGCALAAHISDEDSLMVAGHVWQQ